MMLRAIRHVVIASAKPSHLPSSTISQQSRTFSSSRRTCQPPANATPQALLAYYAQRTPKAVTLPELTKYGAPPLNQTELLEAAENTRKELLCGLARRVSGLYNCVNIEHTWCLLDGYSALRSVVDTQLPDSNQLPCCFFDRGWIRAIKDPGICGF